MCAYGDFPLLIFAVQAAAKAGAQFANNATTKKRTLQFMDSDRET